MSARSAALWAILAIGAAAAADAADWGAATGPAPGPAQVHGSYAAGCVAGAAELPPDGTGYQAIRLSRRRNFGHPDLVDYVVGLGRRVDAAGLGLMLVGDLAQPRGGPMTFGHASHQTGLDVDVWFRLDLPRLPAAEREDPELPSLVDPETGRVAPERWDDGRAARLLRLAAEDPRVERIFVNPAIKRALCEGSWPDPEWLRVVRPWRGHDSHFHVRLRCPPGDLGCVAQDPPPPGDGCGEELTSWLEGPAAAPRAPTAAPAAKRTARALPAACRNVRAAD